MRLVATVLGVSGLEGGFCGSSLSWQAVLDSRVSERFTSAKGGVMSTERRALSLWPSCPSCGMTTKELQDEYYRSFKSIGHLIYA
jgi:hypothetical protein